LCALQGFSAKGTVVIVEGRIMHEKVLSAYLAQLTYRNNHWSL